MKTNFVNAISSPRLFGALAVAVFPFAVAFAVVGAAELVDRIQASAIYVTPFPRPTYPCPDCVNVPAPTGVAILPPKITAVLPPSTRVAGPQTPIHPSGAG